MHCVACVDETAAGPVSLNGFYLSGRNVGQPLTWYRYERDFPDRKVVGETSPGALPICGES